MKYTITTVLALAAVATAVPSPEAAPAPKHGWVGWCGVPGSGCYRKRAATPQPSLLQREAEADPLPHPKHGWIGWCGVPGSGCYRKRAAEVGQLPAVFDESSETPVLIPAGSNSTDYYLGDSVGSCGTPGEPCDNIKRAAFAINDILKDHARANTAPCPSFDSFCEKKREQLSAIANTALDGYDLVVAGEARAEAAAGSPTVSEDGGDEAELPSALIKYCDGKGSQCARKRTASPERRSIVKRCQNCHGHCNAAQQACLNLEHWAYREAHPGKYPVHTPAPTHKPAAKPGAHSTHFHPFTHIGFWCYVKGAPCLKARNVDPQDADELSQPNGIADSLVAIKDAIKQIKRDAADHKTQAPLDKIPYCDKGRCSPITHAHLQAEAYNKPEADKANTFAWGPYGASSHMQGFWNDMEKRVDAAVDSLED